MFQIIYRPKEITRREPVTLPLSKSIALRVMTLNGVCLAQGVAPAHIPLLPDAEDVEGMERAMTCYKKVVTPQGKSSSQGCDLNSERDSDPTSDHHTDGDNHDNGDHPADGDPHSDGKVDSKSDHTVYIGEGGAPLRFFTALAASTPGIDLRLQASPGLMRRPLVILLRALQESGADIQSLLTPGYPPLKIIGKQLHTTHLLMNPGVSSQFVSALMMAAPLWETGLNLTFDGHNPVSTPYIDMTAGIMHRFGLKVILETEEVTGNRRIIVPRAECRPPREFPIESDWSAASYFYEISLLSPGVEIPIANLTPAADSLQGDARCSEIFALLGVETRTDPDTKETTLYCDPEKLELFTQLDTPLILDMNDTPDLVPAMTVGFCLAGIKFRFDSVSHLRHKETDRLTALAAEMEKIGYMLEIGDDSLTWRGRRCPASDNEAICTYSDHRMAMAFAPAAIKLPYLAIEHPEVVGKSFPRYWEQLQRLGFQIADTAPRPLL